jgi:hypothetical protein
MYRTLMFMVRVKHREIHLCDFAEILAKDSIAASISTSDVSHLTFS